MASGPEARKEAARKWAEEAQSDTYKRKTQKALAVLLFTENIRDFLAVNDPISLRQAQQALNNKDYTKYL